MNQIVTITGPSLSGKTTLVRKLEEVGGFQSIVSHTTRPMRAGESNHIDYHFVSEEQYLSTTMVESVKYGDYRYGVAKSSIDEAMTFNQIPVLILEPVGVGQFAIVAARCGWHLLKVFVDISPKNQQMRFVDRMLADSDSSWENYRKRFKLMREEQGWRSSHQWDMFLNNFGPDNEQSVLLALVNRLGRPDLQGSVFQYGRGA